MKPTVKESEKNRILSTTDYGLFILPDYKLSGKFMNEIEDSFNTKNLSKDYPILVEDKTYRIFDYYLVIKTFSDLLEPYNDLLVLINDLYPEIPLQYIIKSTKTACKEFKKKSEFPVIDHKNFQSGKLTQFNFEDTKNRLSTLSLFYTFFSERIEPKILSHTEKRFSTSTKSPVVTKQVRLTWSDAFLICNHLDFDREKIEAEKSFIISVKNAMTSFDRSFYDAYSFAAEHPQYRKVKISKCLDKINW